MYDFVSSDLILTKRQVHTNKCNACMYMYLKVSNISKTNQKLLES